MAVTVKLVQVERVDLERLRLMVEFSEGGLTVTRDYHLTITDDLTPAALRARLRADRDQLQALTAAESALTALINQTL